MTDTATSPQPPHLGIQFYDREIWPLGTREDNDEVVCLLMQGTDRRSYAALNHYLRENESPKWLRARRLARLLPAVTTGHVSFDFEAPDRVEFHDDPDRPGAVPVLIVDQ